MIADVISAVARLPDIDTGVFATLDLRIGRVVSVEPFPQARMPAYKLTVDFGVLGELRTSARVTNYREADLVGRLVVGAVNLGPKSIAGFTSEFLVLGTICQDSTVSLLAPGDDARPGDRVA